MEFDHIGKRCYSCGIQAFCPTECNKCKEFFCQEHIKASAHNCHIKDIVIEFIKCPMCKKKLKIINNADKTISIHMDYKCIKLHPHKYCSIKNCKKSKFTTCKKCNQRLCIDHMRLHRCD